MDYRIIEFEERHIAGIVNIENQCFSSPWTEEEIREASENPVYRFLVAECEDTAGYIGVIEICGEAYITNVAVLPGYRGNGIGRALLKAAVDGAQERNCDFITLEVRESNSVAIDLYKSLGFTEAGKRRNFYTKPDEDAIIYTLTFRKESR
ncbi:MAG: ribosomal protein S18-alanine N-acetyltransferase [Clostridia bacterium]|nr:ribosomal protein S18-alanine N-acetyltransferase [Clostridia bacterium]